MPYGLERWLAGRWIAGPLMEDAISRAKAINQRHISVILNYLGEDFTRKAEVDDAVENYLKLITRMSAEGIHGDISLKPTQIGLCIGYGLMKENYIKIIEKARMSGLFVWLDMEEPKHVPTVIRMYLEVAKHARGGICIQANLKRSLADAKAITKAGGIIRLVKGAYGGKDETGIIWERRDISWNYREVMEYLFDSSKAFTIGTHDPEIIKSALALNLKHKKNVTYAMLNGINNPAAKALVARGEKVSLYVPFGTRWIGYSYRRLKEAGHARLILQSLFTSQQI